MGPTYVRNKADFTLNVSEVAKSPVFAQFSKEQIFGQIKGSMSYSDGSIYASIHPGLLVSISDGRVIKPYTLRILRDGYVGFLYVLNDRSLLTGRTALQLRRACVRISLSPVSLLMHVPDDSHNGPTLSIYVQKQALIEHYGLDPVEIPQPLGLAVRQGAGAEAALTLGLTPGECLAVQAMFRTELTGVTRSMFLRAKAIELISEATARLNTYRTLTGAQSLSPRSRDELRAETVAAVYRRHLDAPPSVNELAGRLGVNRTKLTDCFRDHFGVTPAVYALDQRMSWAREQILSQNARASEVATLLGYAHASAFTRAYTRQFGRTPSGDRAHHRDQE